MTIDPRIPTMPGRGTSGFSLASEAGCVLDIMHALSRTRYDHRPCLTRRGGGCSVCGQVALSRGLGDRNSSRDGEQACVFFYLNVFWQWKNGARRTEAFVCERFFPAGVATVVMKDAATAVRGDRGLAPGPDPPPPPGAMSVSTAAVE